MYLSAMTEQNIMFLQQTLGVVQNIGYNMIAGNFI